MKKESIDVFNFGKGVEVVIGSSPDGSIEKEKTEFYFTSRTPRLPLKDTSGAKKTLSVEFSSMQQQNEHLLNLLSRKRFLGQK